MSKTLSEKIFGTRDDKEIKRLKKIVDKINELEGKFQALKDKELKEKTLEFKNRIKNGETLDDLLVEAFATVKEVSRRLDKKRHHDVQLIGGMILHSGNIAEMKTGEGKTLMSLLPIYLNALLGKGVHVITANEYLARRDREIASQIFDFLEISTAVVVTDMTKEEKKQAYLCDVTYGINSVFGFDYLKDNMVKNKEDKVQRGHHYAIVDEIDSILIDGARTPLVISGPTKKTTKWYMQFFEVGEKLKRSYETENIKDKKSISINAEIWEDYEVDEKSKTISLTDKGISNVEKILNIENLYLPENVELTHYLIQALKAKELYKKDRDYIINDKNEVVIIDKFTGRVLEGRRYSNGLHQAIEAKEGLEIAKENETLATITFQNYFKMYKKLSGMTGTAKTEEEEFKQIYNLKVIEVPTNKPEQRIDLPDIVYMTKKAKDRAIIKKIKELYEKGQPVLVGTSTIEHSEELAEMLRIEEIPFELLNAKYHEKEAEIIAQAGQYKRVTIATNMAGRGTDIKLGGDPEAYAMKLAKKGTKEYNYQLRNYEIECTRDKRKVLWIGGLYIIGAQRHENRRIDNQLRGRAGRQGDPGVSEFYVSLDDDLLKTYGSGKIKATVELLDIDENTEISNKRISKIIENAQKRVESRNFSTRKKLIEYEMINNQQREVVYNQRDFILENENLNETIKDMIKSTLEIELENSYSEETKQIDLNLLKNKLKELFNYEISDEMDNIANKNELLNKICDELCIIYDEKIEVIGKENFENAQKYLMLEILDLNWREHIKNLNRLKEGIKLRAYAQKDPLREYTISSSEMYNEMIETIKKETSSLIFKINTNKNNRMNRLSLNQKITTKNTNIDSNVPLIEDKNIDISKSIEQKMLETNITDVDTIKEENIDTNISSLNDIELNNTELNDNTENVPLFNDIKLNGAENNIITTNENNTEEDIKKENIEKISKKVTEMVKTRGNGNNYFEIKTEINPFLFSANKNKVDSFDKMAIGLILNEVKDEDISVGEAFKKIK